MLPIMRAELAAQRSQELRVLAGRRRRIRAARLPAPSLAFSARELIGRRLIAMGV